MAPCIFKTVKLAPPLLERNMTAKLTASSLLELSWLCRDLAFSDRGGGLSGAAAARARFGHDSIIARRSRGRAAPLRCASKLG